MYQITKGIYLLSIRAILQTVKKKKKKKTLTELLYHCSLHTRTSQGTIESVNVNVRVENF